MSFSSSTRARLRRRLVAGLAATSLIAGTLGVQVLSAESASALDPCVSVALAECGGGGGGGGTVPYAGVSGDFPPDVVIGVPMSAQFTGIYAQGPYAYSANLPAGLSIDGNGLVSGTPTGPTGSFSGQVTARPAFGYEGSAVFTTRINDRPRYAGAGSATASTATQASIAVQATGYPAPTHTVVAGALPPGLTMSADGLITGVPLDTATGSHAFTVRASNPFGTLSIDFTIAVTETRPPLVGAQPAAQAVTAGSAVTFTASATRFSSVQWERGTAGGGWLPISGATSPSYTRATTATDHGSSYRAVFTGPGGTTATTAAALTVRYLPVFPASTVTPWTAGRGNSLLVTVDANPAAVLSATGLPAWMTLTDNGDNSATLSGTPPVDVAGDTFAVSLTARNAVGASTGAASVIVHRAPVVSSSPSDVTAEPGATFAFEARAGGGFPAPAVQWQRSTDHGATYANVDGATAPTYSGLASVVDDGARYRAVFTNSAGDAASSAAVLRVGIAPHLTSASSASFAEGVAGSVTITATGTPLPEFSASGLPTWLAFTNGAAGTATLSGTPPVGAGDVVVTLTASNGFDPVATQAFSLAVHRSAVFTSGSTSTLTQGEPGSFVVTTRAGAPVARSLTVAGSLPSGVSFIDNGDGTATIAGTPLAGTGGVFRLRVTASTVGGVSAPATQDLTLTVDERARFTSADHSQFAVGVAARFDVTTDPGYPAATTLTARGLPDGLAFVDNGDGTASIEGTPGSTTAGMTSVTITAANGVAAGTAQVFVVTVNASPAFSGARTATFQQGDAESFTIRTGGGFPVATRITGSGALPAGVTLVDNGDGTATVSGRPAAASGGSYPITVTASASGGTTPPSRLAFVLVVNELARFTSAGHATLRAGEAASVLVATSAGFPAARALSVTGSLPSGLAFTDNGDGTGLIEGVPSPSAAGSHRVTLLADNGLAATGSQELSITVDSSPSFTSAAVVDFRTGESSSSSITTSAGFPDSRTLSLTGALPGGLVFTDGHDGSATISGTPAAGSGGEYPVELTAASVGATSLPATQRFVIIVNEPAAVTSATAARFQFATQSGFEVVTTPGYPVATTLSASGPLPAGLRFVDNGDGTATIAGVPSEFGVFPVTVVATNGPVSANQQLRLTVAAPPILRAVGDLDAVIGVPTTASIVTTAGYPAATVVSLDSPLPRGLEFAAHGDGTASITGSAAPGTAGVYPLDIRASNGIGLDAVSTSVISVVEAPVVPLPPSEPLSTESLLGVPDAATVRDTIDVRGSGFAPGSVVTVGIYSTPRQLGTAIAGATGDFSLRLVLPADLTGRHTIVAAGTALDGDLLFLVSGIVISEAPASGVAPAAGGAASAAALASTGADVASAFWIALLLGLAGVLMARAGRRRAPAGE